MSAVALLATAFVAIALVGTALAAAHDAIAAAIDRSDASTDRTDRTRRRTVVLEPSTAGAGLPALRATRIPGPQCVRVRHVEHGAAPAARG